MVLKRRSGSSDETGANSLLSESQKLSSQSGSASVTASLALALLALPAPVPAAALALALALVLVVRHLFQHHLCDQIALVIRKHLQHSTAQQHAHQALLVAYL